MEMEKVLEIIKRNVKLEGIAFDLIDMVLEPALEKVVADSANQMDDMLMKAIYPVLEKEIKELIKEQLEKVLGSAE